MSENGKDEALEGLSGVDLGEALLERACEQLPPNTLRAVEVPTLRKGDGAVPEVWVKPLTLDLRDRLIRKATKKGIISDGLFSTLIVIYRSFDAEGRQIWTEKDHLARLLRGTAGDWVADLAREITGAPLPDEEDLEGDQAAADHAGNSSGLREVAG